jgi:abhydrolase domain-containing protein 6
MNSKTKMMIVPAGLMLLLFSVSCSSSMVAFFNFLARFQAGLSEKSVQVNNYKIAYLEGGKGETIMLVHGFACDKDTWNTFDKYLTKKYHVIVPDLPGWGESTRIMTDNYGIESQVTRLQGFVVNVGLKKFHIVGSSMGGLISGKYAAKYPSEIQSLGLLNPMGVKSPEKSQLSIELKEGRNPFIVKSIADYDNYLNFMCVKPPSIPGPIKSYIVQKFVEGTDFGNKVFSESSSSSFDESTMKGINSKTLIIWGDKDRVFHVSCAKVLEKGIKNSKVLIMKDCGHAPMVERPEETAKYYLDFIKL